MGVLPTEQQMKKMSLQKAPKVLKWIDVKPFSTAKTQATSTTVIRFQLKRGSFKYAAQQILITAGFPKPFYPLCRQPGQSRSRPMRLGLLTPFLPALPVVDLRGHFLLQRLELLRSLLRLLVVGQTSIRAMSRATHVQRQHGWRAPESPGGEHTPCFVWYCTGNHPTVCNFWPAKLPCSLCTISSAISALRRCCSRSASPQRSGKMPRNQRFQLVSLGWFDRTVDKLLMSRRVLPKIGGHTVPREGGERERERERKREREREEGAIYIIQCYIYIYKYACIHIYIYTYIHIYIYTYIHIYINTYIHIYIYTYIHIYIYTYIHIYISTYKHIYIWTSIYIYLHMCKFTYLKTFIHIYTYTPLHIYIFT